MNKDKKVILIELPMDIYEKVFKLAQIEERSIRYIIKKLVEKGVQDV